MWRRAIAGAVVAVLLAGCSGLLTGCSGRDAVAQGGTFEFVSPGGKTDIFYDPPATRGRPGPLSGPDLMNPTRTLSVDDPTGPFAGQVVVINVWGQWCGPCRAEVTQLQQVYDATVIPSTLVLDRQHRVAAVFLRALLAEDLQPVVQKVAQETAPAPTSPGRQ
jgi:thiol-disulfide isomerase/thioredoxin